MALIRFLDGKQRSKTTTVDDAAIKGEGRYRFEKHDLTKKGGRVNYLQEVSKKRWADKKVPGVDGSTRRPPRGLNPNRTETEGGRGSVCSFGEAR